VKLWRIAGRALDFSLYVVFLDGTLDKYADSASEAVCTFTDYIIRFRVIIIEIKSPSSSRQRELSLSIHIFRFVKCCLIITI
jgi:hypothetical protein